MRNHALALAAGSVLAALIGSASADWPAYRSDVGRSGFAPTKLPDELAVAWVHRPVQGPRAAWPKPARRSFWTRIGAAWENKDGSLNLRFQAAPLSLTEGTVQLRKIEEKEEKKAA